MYGGYVVELKIFLPHLQRHLLEDGLGQRAARGGQAVLPGPDTV